MAANFIQPKKFYPFFIKLQIPNVHKMPLLSNTQNKENTILPPLLFSKYFIFHIFKHSNTKHTQNAILKQNTKFYQNMSVNKRVTEL